MNAAQVAMLLAQYRATYSKTLHGTEWWRLPNGEWLGKRQTSPGVYELKRFAANACGCGG